jgi:tight adherence protein C
VIQALAAIRRRARRPARERERTLLLIDGLHALVDRLRSGESLRQALTRSAQGDGSPFHPVATELAAGRSIVHTLRDAAAGCSEPDLASVLCILAVHAEAGGDPTLACRALADRLGRRLAARDEARALTTQARIGARAILLLTPAFLLLVSASDPRGTIVYLSEPRTRLALAAGLCLQVVGAWWIAGIVASIGSPAPTARVPFVRVLRALLLGRHRSTVDDECAEAAEITAFALEAGLSPTAALRTTAPFYGGAFGVAASLAVHRDDVPVHVALAESVAGLDGEAPSRFARAFMWSAELGVPLARSLRALAEDVRDASQLHLVEDVRRASMRVLVPLGVLILPAFVLACLVPLFVGGMQGIAG